MKKGFLITAAILLTGCGGGGGSSDSGSATNSSKSTETPDTTLINSDHAGLYVGTYLNASNQQGDTVLFVTTENQSYIISDDAEIAIGSVTETDIGLNIDSTFYGSGSESDWGANFTSSLAYNLGTLSGSYSLAGDTGTLSLIQRDEILNRSVNVSTLDGTWIDKDGEELTISNASISQDAKEDCDFTGTLSQIGDLNQFNITMNVFNCTDSSVDGEHNGFAFLSDEEGENSTLNILSLQSTKAHFGLNEITRK